jgi:hypothetical protein
VSLVFNWTVLAVREIQILIVMFVDIDDDGSIVVKVIVVFVCEIFIVILLFCPDMA